MKIPSLSDIKISLIVLMLTLYSCAGWQGRAETVAVESVKCFTGCMNDCLLDTEICFKACAVACVPKAVREIMKEKVKKENASNKCWLCDDKEVWKNGEDDRTLLCPVCNPIGAMHQSLATINLPAWGSAQWRQMIAKYYGPMFQIKPWLLVMHSGSKAARVAEYFQEPEDDRKVSTHLAWSAKLDNFAQCVSFSNIAWHVGGSRYRGMRRLNMQSIGIELAGPYDKNRDDEKERIINCVTGVCNILPSLTTIVRHSDIDEKKKDPGQGFKMKWLEFTGLHLVQSA